MDELNRTHTSSRLISASSARIHSACIQPEELVCWIAPEGAEAAIEQFEAREGGNFEIILSFGSEIENLPRSQLNDGCPRSARALRLAKLQTSGRHNIVRRQMRF